MIGEPVLGRASEGVLRVAPRYRRTTGPPRANLAGPRALPDEVIVFSTDEIESGEMTFYVDIVAGRSWQISAGSFFQSSGEGAELLIDSINDALDHLDRADGRLRRRFSTEGLACSPGRSVIDLMRSPWLKGRCRRSKMRP